MGPTTATRNRRRLFRETLNATAALRVRDEEFLCKTSDISESGLGLLVREASLEVDEPIEADVLIGSIVKTFRGVVLYAKPLSDGPVRVGMRFADHSRVYGTVEAQASEAAGERGSDHGEAEGLGGEVGPEEARTNHRPTSRRRARLQVQLRPRSHEGFLDDLANRITVDALVRLLIRKGLVSQEEIVGAIEAGRVRTLPKTQAQDTEH